MKLIDRLFNVLVGKCVLFFIQNEDPLYHRVVNGQIQYYNDPEDAGPNN